MPFDSKNQSHALCNERILLYFLPAKMFCLHRETDEMEHLNRLHFVIPSIHLLQDIALQIQHILVLWFLQYKTKTHCILIPLISRPFQTQNVSECFVRSFVCFCGNNNTLGCCCCQIKDLFYTHVQIDKTNYYIEPTDFIAEIICKQKCNKISCNEPLFELSRIYLAFMKINRSFFQQGNVILVTINSFINVFLDLIQTSSNK